MFRTEPRPEGVALLDGDTEIRVLSIQEAQQLRSQAFRDDCGLSILQSMQLPKGTPTSPAADLARETINPTNLAVNGQIH